MHEGGKRNRPVLCHVVVQEVAGDEVRHLIALDVLYKLVPDVGSDAAIKVRALDIELPQLHPPVNPFAADHNEAPSGPQPHVLGGDLFGEVLRLDLVETRARLVKLEIHEAHPLHVGPIESDHE